MTIYLSKNNRNFIHLKSYFNKLGFVFKIRYVSTRFEKKLLFQTLLCMILKEDYWQWAEIYLQKRIWFAYQEQDFPWFNPEDDILWWCPDPRFVLFPEDLKISKSMKKILREGKIYFYRK